MPDSIETQIRKALDAKAHEVDVPEALALRTLEVAREQRPQPLFGRLKDWRVTRRVNARPSGYPPMLYAAGAAACAVLLFVVGTVVMREPGAQPTIAAAPEVRRSADGDVNAVSQESPPPEEQLMDTPPLRGPSGVTSSGDAVAGQVAGTVTAPSAPDQARANTSTDSDAESGDSDFSDQAIDVETGDASGTQEGSSFVGLTGGEGTTMSAPVPGGPFLDPQLVKSANIRVAVKDFDPAWDQANDVASKFGGAVIGSRTQLIADRIAEGTVTMRVPSVKLDQVIADLRGLGTLAELTTSGDDIAEQIDSVKHKVADARNEERELIDRQARAATSGARLEATERLESVRKAIDALKAKQRKYEDQVEFSAVSATIFEDASMADDGPILGRALEKGVTAALTILAGTLVVLGGLIPLAILGLVVWFVLRASRRRRAT